MIHSSVSPAWLLCARPLACLTAAVILAVSSMAAQADDQVPVIPASNWKAIAKEGDSVKVADRGDVLNVAYEVTINQSRRVGHQTQQEASFTLELKKPIALTKEQMRFYFEARAATAPKGTLEVRPVIEDENGERISYEAVEIKSFKKKGSPNAWKFFKTQSLLMAEAGGATQNIYDAEGGDQNSWPDGKLRLVGLQVRVKENPAKKDQLRWIGELDIAALSIGKLQVTDYAFAYADAFFKTKGKYQIDFELMAAFQGKPIRETSQTLEFDPADPNSLRQRIALPLEKIHNSWLNYCIKNEKGELIDKDSLRWEQAVAPDFSAQWKTLDPAKPPLVGQVRINPERPGSVYEAGGFYAAEEPFVVVMRIFPPKNGVSNSLKLDWKLTPYQFQTALENGAQEVSFAGRLYVDVPLKLTEQEKRDAYKLRFTLSDSAGNKVDDGAYILGIRYKTIPPYLSRKGTLPDRNEIKKYPYFRTSFLSNEAKKDASEQTTLNTFRTMIAESRQMANHITYLLDLADFEILPGVYDFYMLDQVMDMAADNGCGITVRIGHAEQPAPYVWMPYTIPRSFDGTALEGHEYYGCFTLTDPLFVESWMKSSKALHERYAQHPGFEGYFVMQPGGEWTLPDQPWKGYISGYSWAETQAFRKYLQEKLGLDLKGLNARWHTAYQSWDEVYAPQPDLKSGSKPDLRPQWTDLSRCKLSWKDSWYINVAKHIRSFDQTHLIITYGGWNGPYKQMPGLVDYLHNGGNHFLDGEELLVDAWEKDKLGWITEPHHPHRWAAYGDPAQRGWVLDWSVFVMTAQAGGGGQNLHVYYMPNPTQTLAAHYGGSFAYDRYELFKPILRELHGSKLIQSPKQIAVIQDMDTLLAKHRTVFGGRLTDLRRWFELLKDDALDFEDYQPEREANYKLVVLNPLDEVTGQASITNMDRMVRNGSWLVMSAGSAKYCPEHPEKPYPLLAQLGILPPKGKFETNEAGVKAKLDPKQAIFSNRESVPFFSQSDMRQQIKDPEIGKDFWKWPYRWIPQTDYFGYFKGNTGVEGQIIARFPDGGAALSLHSVGKGQVLVFWGTPDMSAENLKGVMAAIASQAGVVNPRAGSPIPHMLEAERKDIKRHYALLYSEKAGSCVQKIPNAPDGDWFIDDMVSGQRFGTFSGETLRQTGMKIDYAEGVSPLKVLRMISPKGMGANWLDKYPQPK